MDFSQTAKFPPVTSAGALVSISSMDKMFIVSAGIIIGLIILIISVICICKAYADKEKGKGAEPLAYDASLNDNKGDSQLNLIPPIFYTENMRDPLYQEDLREKCIYKK